MGFDPLTWALARLGSSLGPALAFGLILLILFWGRLLGALRRVWLGARSAARRRAGTGPLCPDCALSLQGTDARRDCPGCRGAWLQEVELTRLLAAKRRPAKEWVRAPEASACVLCPVCAKTIPVGHLLGEDFAVYRCQPCAGLWFGSTERVSLELRVLG
ncbi:MAG: zf-TFIIB domain-containing protein [Elusimicrobia bacterium]|nr:zf-TFIIB domain-containing protein [Elusimicrobiota bacterium]